MKRCINCILPETFPDISFNSEGLCSVCQEYEKRDIKGISMEILRKKFNDLITEGKSRSKQYDALIAYSGGKDSTYLIYKMKKDYDLNILAVTMDNGFITRKTFDNIRTIVDNMNVDHFVFKPGFDVAKRIFTTSANDDIYPKSLLKVGSSVCISCIRMVTNICLRMAIEKKIPMIMLGNSPGQIIQSESEIMYQDNKIPYELKKNLFNPLADKVGKEVYPYLMLEKEDYHTNPFPYTISPFPMIGYDEKEIYRTIETLGWKRPQDVDSCSTNCQLNSYGIVKHCQKHNYHPYEYELSSAVRLGTLTREEAITRIEDSTDMSYKLAVNVEKRLINIE